MPPYCAVSVNRLKQIRFQNVGYHVPADQQHYWFRRTSSSVAILDNVSGTIESAKMTALMGPSGSGKTTLLDVLAGRADSCKISGEILYNEHRFEDNMKTSIAYVEQDVTLYETLTVKEIVLYSAYLRNHCSRNDDHIIENEVDVVLSLMGLTGCKDMRIGGGLMRGASGGEIKRACIAAELVADPSMLFLDEPTTGLDSETALELMRIVKDYVCEKGIGVVCSIHQPSGELFHLFDYLYVIAKGRIVYNGLPKLAVQAFIDRGFDFDVKKLSHAEFVSSAALQLSKNPDYKSHLSCVIATSPPDPTSESDKLGRKPEYVFANSIWSNTCVLLRRRLVVTIRDKFQIASRLVKDVLSAVLIALVFWDTGHVGRHNITKRVMGLIITITIHALCSTFYIPSIVRDRQIYVRETGLGMYQPGAHHLSAILFDLPSTFLSSIVSTAIAYPSIPLRMELSAILVHLGIISLNMDYFMAVTQAVTTFTSSAEMAISTCGFLVGFLSLFNGYSYDPRNMDRFMRFIAKLTPLNYAFSSLAVNEFANNPLYPLNGNQALDLLGLADENGQPLSLRWLLFETIAMWATVRLLAYVLTEYIQHKKS